MSSCVDDGLSSALSDLQVEAKTETAHIDKPGTESMNKKRRLGDGLELCIFASVTKREGGGCVDDDTLW